MRVIASICALVFIGPGICVSDESFRCGSWIVSSEMSVAELLDKCGKPTSQEVSTHAVVNSHGVKIGTSKTEIWRYDRGSMAAPMIVTIVDGQIQSMDRGE
jgi:hypothetical protein